MCLAQVHTVSFESIYQLLPQFNIIFVAIVCLFFACFLAVGLMEASKVWVQLSLEVMGYSRYDSHLNTALPTKIPIKNPRLISVHNEFLATLTNGGINCNLNIKVLNNFLPFGPVSVQYAELFVPAHAGPILDTIFLGV